MVDRTTLPNLPGNTTLTAGQRFTIKGDGFNYWPAELVLSSEEQFVENEEIGNINIMKLVSKTNDTLVFEVIAGYTYVSPHLWQFFGTPFDTPREVLAYEPQT